MSRLTATKANGRVVAFGLDHAVGWFYQEYISMREEPVVDLDSLFTGLGRGRLLELLEDTDATTEQKSRIALDLDPAG